MPTAVSAQVSDNALVKHLLTNSRTLEVYHKDPSGASFLEVIVKELETKPFIAYADCIDELLGLRVPISLPALSGLWQHIVGKADKIRWVIDEEYNPEQEAKEALKVDRAVARCPESAGSPSQSLKDELEALNKKTVPVGAAHIPKSVFSMSTGSAVRVSAGHDRLAPVMEQESDESRPPTTDDPPSSAQDQNGSEPLLTDATSAGEGTNGHSPLPLRSPNVSLAKRHSFDEERPAASLLAPAPAGRQLNQATSKLSKSAGSAAVQSTFSVSPVRRMSAGSSITLPASAAVGTGEEPEGEDHVDLDHLVTTPSGFKALRWNVALGELLAHDSDLFLPREVAITSLRSALRASSMMLVQWRVDPTAVTAKIPATGETALHVAAKCEVRLNSLFFAACVCYALVHTFAHVHMLSRARNICGRPRHQRACCRSWVSRAPVQRTIQDCICFQGVCPNNSTRLPVHACCRADVGRSC